MKATILHEGYYFVVRSYSGVTAKTNLLQVLSRRMSKQQAEDWADFEKSESQRTKRQGKIFVIKCEEV